MHVPVDIHTDTHKSPPSPLQPPWLNATSKWSSFYSKAMLVLDSYAFSEKKTTGGLGRVLCGMLAVHGYIRVTARGAPSSPPLFLSLPLSLTLSPNTLSRGETGCIALLSACRVLVVVVVVGVGRGLKR